MSRESRLLYFTVQKSQILNGFKSILGLFSDWPICKIGSLRAAKTTTSIKLKIDFHHVWLKHINEDYFSLDQAIMLQYGFWLDACCMCDSLACSREAR